MRATIGRMKDLRYALKGDTVGDIFKNLLECNFARTYFKDFSELYLPTTSNLFTQRGFSFLLHFLVFLLTEVSFGKFHSFWDFRFLKSKENKYSCSGPPVFKSGSCKLRFS